MKIKANTLVSSINIFKQIDMTKMKLSTAYKFRKILEEAEKAIGDFESRRMVIAEKHGTLSEDKTKYLFETETEKAAFQDELMELMDDEFELEITPIPLELVDDYITVEPAGVELISWAISGLE
jgi:hypothetical protein